MPSRHTTHFIVSPTAVILSCVPVLFVQGSRYKQNNNLYSLCCVMPGFHHSVAVSPFCRRKMPFFCKNYVRKFRSVTAVNSKKIRSGSGNCNGNGVRKRQRLTETANRQRKNGNGMVETGHYSALCMYSTALPPLIFGVIIPSLFARRQHRNQVFSV